MCKDSYKKDLALIITIFFILVSSSSFITNIEAYEIRNNQIENYDLVIITPSDFYEDLITLKEHKESHDIKTNITILDNLYNDYPGRDEPEKIKYFIKDAIEKWNISYVLLVGDINKLPIRKTNASIWPEDEKFLISDLYYSDVYDTNGSFCSWDANENDIFGEIKFNDTESDETLNSNSVDFKMNCIYCYEKILTIVNLDDVDLNPDVMIGRLPCSNKEELEIVVDKIIRYENETNNQSWFKRIIAVGGDDQQEFDGYEGEIATGEVLKYLTDFEQIKLWSSENNFSPLKFNKEINKGAGFVAYSGNAEDFILGIYPPVDKTFNKIIRYHSFYIKFLRNKDKLPIMFFDACSTAGLDFNLENLTRYSFYRACKLLTILPKFEKDTLVSCIAWDFIKEKNGGAVAAIGATKISHSLENETGVHVGGGALMVNFFKNYEEGITLGEMFTKAQKDYLTDIIINKDFKDFVTLEIFTLLGDPTLKVGGYAND